MNPILRYLACATFLLLAGGSRLVAQSVVVMDVIGTWQRVSPPSQNLTRFQILPARERIRLIVSDPFVPGSLVLATSDGRRYFALACRDPEPCSGVFEVPPPPPATPTTVSPPWGKVFKTIVDLIAHDSTGFVNAVSNVSAPPQGGALADSVLPLTDGSLDLCDAFRIVNPDRYRIRLSPHSAGAPVIGNLDWTGQCPARMAVGGAAPGIYLMQSTDTSGRGDTAYILVCSSAEYEVSKAAFREISNDTDAWNGVFDGVTMHPASRRAFLVGYLHWLADRPVAGPPGHREPIRER